MSAHTPNELPPLMVDFGKDAYGYEATFVRTHAPRTPDEVGLVQKMCELGIYQGAKIENAYPAHIGGVEYQVALRSLAKRYGTELQFPLAKEI